MDDWLAPLVVLDSWWWCATRQRVCGMDASVAGSGCDPPVFGVQPGCTPHTRRRRKIAWRISQGRSWSNARAKQHRHNAVTMPPQHRYNVVTAPSRRSRSTVTAPSLCRRNAVAKSSQHRRNAEATPSKRSHDADRTPSQSRHDAVVTPSQRCCNAVAAPSQSRYKVARRDSLDHRRLIRWIKSR